MLIVVQRLIVALFLLGAITAKACDFATSSNGRRLQEDDAWSITNFTTTNSSSNNNNNTAAANNSTNTTATTSSNTTDVETTAAPSSFNTTTTTNATESPTSSSPCEAVDDVNPVRVDLRMMARQTRGVLRILSSCQFEAVRLEVALADTEQSIELDWYSAVSLEEEDAANRTLLARGGTFTADELTGNSSLLFAIVDTSDANLSTVGAILLCERQATTSNETTTKVLGQALLHKLKPGPAADLLAAQPTIFEHCLELSPTVRLRWTVYDYFLDVGLEYIVPFGDAAGTWMGFGPASPGIEDRLMGGSDVMLGGFREEDDGMAFAEDYYIGGYEICTKLTTTNDASNHTYDGVCRDSVWTGDGTDDDRDENVELLYFHVLEGVALLRVRRPLAATTPAFDHDIILGTKQNFVWARGPLLENGGIAKVQFHGYQFGQLKDMDVNETTWTCPPLQGVELSDPLSLNTTSEEDDSLAQKFEHRTVLLGNIVEVFWTLLPETSQIHIGARAIVGSSSRWMSIAVGDSMTDAWAWVATVDGDEPQLLGYRMSGLDAATVRLVSTPGEEQNNPMFAGNHTVSHEGGHLAFEVIAQWPLPGMDLGDTAAPLIWAVGPSWRGPAATSPQRQDEHSLRSKAPTMVDFATGGASVGKPPDNSMLLAHGALMWLAWLLVAPLTSVASRYIRNDPCLPDDMNPNWIQLHKAGATAVMVLSIVGLVLAVVAVSDTGLRHIVSAHAKVGLALLSMIVVQNLFGLLRPPPAASPPATAFTFTKRRLWELSHRILAITMLSVAIAAVITGSNSLEDYDTRVRYGVPLSISWIVMVALFLAVFEFRRMRINSAKDTVDSATPDKSAEEVEALGDEDLSKETPEKTLPSPWIGTWWLVYAVPGVLGIVGLVVLAAVTFSGSTSYGQIMETSTTSNSFESTEATTDPITEVEPVSEPYIPTTSFNAPERCDAWPPSHVGDGWCDDFEPFNTEACAWDGGDCCDINAPLYNCRNPNSPHFGAASPRGWGSPIMIARNPRYTVSREETLESFVISYNNYYEFGFSKDVVEEANKHADFLAPDSWYVDISGLVENPMTLDVTSLIDQMQLEERLYRHRCVEAWSITAPWVGFPLTKLLDIVRPAPDAAIVQFVSWENNTISRYQASSNYPWPYTEALTIEEARNELTMITVGAFGKPLTPQQGAPIRLTVPWKYGFKSIKSIEKITFLADDGAESRRTFWSEQNSREYGFYANVNPEVPHRRWSQATERHYVEGYPAQRLDTTRMNGYQAQVDYLYADDIENADIYF